MCRVENEKELCAYIIYMHIALFILNPQIVPFVKLMAKHGGVLLHIASERVTVIFK